MSDKLCDLTDFIKSALLDRYFRSKYNASCFSFDILLCFPLSLFVSMDERKKQRWASECESGLTEG